MAFTNNDDVNLLQASDLSVVGAGGGSDRYVLDSSLLRANQKITVQDTLGLNILHLVGGLTIVNAKVANNAIQLSFNNGTGVTILDASTFKFQTGGNSINGTGGVIQDYASFVTQSLGVVSGVPASGIVDVTKTVIVNANGGTRPDTIEVTAGGAQATSGADVFSVDVASALTDTAGTNFQPSITGFFTLMDKLWIDLPTADAGITNLSQLNGKQGVSVSVNPFSNSTSILLGNDLNGGEAVVVTLVGVTDTSATMVEIV